MGFFSWICVGCGHPMLSAYATDDVNDWMRFVVVQYENGTRLVGEYDGYGRVDDQEILHGAECWHKACHENLGSPAYGGESESAPDQGFFFEDGEHDLAEPGVSTPKTGGDHASD